MKTGIKTMGLATCMAALACSAWGCASEPTAQDEGVVRMDDGLVFDEPYSDGGRFKVFRLADGAIGWSVTGRIGADDPDRVGALLTRSPLESYMNLRPDLTAPPAGLVELDRLVTPPTSNDARQPIEVPKDQAQFQANTCHTFTSNCDRWSPVECAWGENANRAKTSNFICPGSGDLSFYWNHDSALGIHTLSNPSTGGSSTYAVSAYTWGYNVWPAFYSCGPVSVFNSTPGQLGVTAHWWSFNSSCVH